MEVLLLGRLRCERDTSIRRMWTMQVGTTKSHSRQSKSARPPPAHHWAINVRWKYTPLTVVVQKEIYYQRTGGAR